MNTLPLLRKLIGLSATSLTNIIQVDKAGQNLEELILSIADEMPKNEQSDVIEQLEEANCLSKLQALYETYETNLENTFVEKLVAQKLTGIQTYRLYDRFTRLIQNEIELGDITASDRVAFIGSGPLPITAILLHQLSGCWVDCYEHYLPAAEISRTVINMLNKQDAISIIHMPGQQIDAKPYSAVLIALLAKPKRPILQKISSTMSSATQVICRTSDGLRQVFYETIHESRILPFTIVDNKEAHGDETISSLRLNLEQ